MTGRPDLSALGAQQRVERLPLTSNRSPKATPTRSRTRSPTPSSTRSSRRIRARASPPRRCATPAWWCWPARSRPTPTSTTSRSRATRSSASATTTPSTASTTRAARSWSAYDKQSNDIAQGVDHASDDHLNTGAGDQGLMFGYACDETPELMPAPIYYAHRLVERQAQLRKDGRLPFLRPDAKSQVTMRYVDGKPHSIDTVVLSTPAQTRARARRRPKMKASFIEARDRGDHQAGAAQGVAEGHALPDQPDRPLRHRRPAGRLRPDRPQDHRRHLRRRLPARRRRVLGQGPDARSTARPRTRRATSPRTSSPPASPRQCQIQVAYAIGVAKPMNVTVYTEGTGMISDDKIAGAGQRALRPAPEGHHPDARPAAPDLREDRRLRPLRPRQTEFSWERTDKAASAEGRGRPPSRATNLPWSR